MEFEQIKKYTEDLKVLYVEDDEDSLKETKDILNVFFQIITVSLNGKDALDKYKHYFYKTGLYYDLVITDINMPVMSGDILVDKLKIINKEQAIVVMSAYSDESKLIRFIKQGVKDFLKKPVTSIELKDVLYSVCKNIAEEKDKKDEIKKLKKGNTVSFDNDLKNTKEYDILDIMY